MGWLKSLFQVFHTSLQENPNKLFLANPIIVSSRLKKKKKWQSWDSAPGLPVPALHYLPDSPSWPFSPAVLSLHLLVTSRLSTLHRQEARGSSIYLSPALGTAPGQEWMNERYSPKPQGRRQPHCSSQVGMIHNLHPHPACWGEGEIWGEGQVAAYTIYREIWGEEQVAAYTIHKEIWGEGQVAAYTIHRWLFPIVNFSLAPRAQSLITGAVPSASREDRCCCILYARKAILSPPFTTLCNIKSSWSFIGNVSFKSTCLRILLFHFYYCGL